jgi:hypothetical protein
LVQVESKGSEKYVMIWFGWFDAAQLFPVRLVGKAEMFARLKKGGWPLNWKLSSALRMS